MTYKLKLIKTIVPEKSLFQKWAESPVGWWRVTTEGDVEGHTTDDLGTFYGHVAEIAFSLKGGGYSLRFEKAKQPEKVKATAERLTRQIVTKQTNISFGSDSNTYGCKGVAFDKMLAAWLDCPEVEVLPCNYHSAFTIKLKA